MDDWRWLAFGAVLRRKIDCSALNDMAISKTHARGLRGTCPSASRTKGKLTAIARPKSAPVSRRIRPVSADKVHRRAKKKKEKQVVQAWPTSNLPMTMNALDNCHDDSLSKAPEQSAAASEECGAEIMQMSELDTKESLHEDAAPVVACKSDSLQLQEGKQFGRQDMGKRSKTQKDLDEACAREFCLLNILLETDAKAASRALKRSTAERQQFAADWEKIVTEREEKLLRDLNRHQNQKDEVKLLKPAILNAPHEKVTGAIKAQPKKRASGNSSHADLEVSWRGDDQDHSWPGPPSPPAVMSKSSRPKSAAQKSKAKKEDHGSISPSVWHSASTEEATTARAQRWLSGSI